MFPFACSPRLSSHHVSLTSILPTETKLTQQQLSKEDEAATGADEIEVRREDQDKINNFSRLHQRGLNLDDELKAKQKEKEDLEDISNELELADEDDLIPCVIPTPTIAMDTAH